MRKILTILTAVALGATACKTEMIDRVPPATALENGAYMRTISITPSNQQMSVANPNAQITYEIEAVDNQKGGLLQSYDLQIRFVDRTPANGTNNVAYRNFRSIPASAFNRHPVSGLPRHTMVIRLSEALQALGLQSNQIAATDLIEIDATLRLTNGRAFNARNTGANITGGVYYNSPFFYRITLVP
ncbi:MAG: hypothetical protein RMJ44_11510 [Cytophagales bacterium]|nr:hypothetical protein [Bernardetiaceae bacterium]MDW8211703.1 hypothetical protein [Cytophagales bacterium]